MRKIYESSQKTLQELAGEYRTTRQNVSLIVRGESYTDPAWGTRDYRHRKGQQRPLPNVLIRKVRTCYKRTLLNMKEVAGKFGLGDITVRHILHGDPEIAADPKRFFARKNGLRNRKLTDHYVRRIRLLMDAVRGPLCRGNKIWSKERAKCAEKLAGRHGVHSQTIYRIARGDARKLCQ